MPNTWIELDWNVLRANVRAVRGALRPPAELVFVVKARAYGHGMCAAARCAWSAGVRCFLVSHLDEATELRAALANARILLLGAVAPADLGILLRARITPVFYSFAAAHVLAAAARAEGAVLACHVKIDTGMGRLGLGWAEASGQLQKLQRCGGLRLEGLCTHFAAGARRQGGLAALQARRFRQVAAACRAHGITFRIRHISNSAAFGAHPEWDLDAVRCGIHLYGYGESAAHQRAPTRPLLQWKTTVMNVKRVPAGFPVGYSSTYQTPVATTLATINAGYADGLSRQLSNCGQVLIRGRRARIAGRVSMNFTVVDAGPNARVQPGDEAVLIGRQGRESIWADEMARWCRTIPYEVLTSIRSQSRETTADHRG